MATLSLGFAMFVASLCRTDVLFAQTAQPAICESQSKGGDALRFTCPVDVSGANERFRFKVDFSGGHDDTMASMVLMLDGESIACDPGSKTRLMGEDGDVSLLCTFKTDQNAGSARQLQVELKWSHAQYTGYTFGAE